MLCSKAMLGTAAFLIGALVATSALAQTCAGPMRKINIGVAVAPPNVVHTAPYVAKALGFFAKRCVDANIIQFDGGAAGTSVTAVGQGSAISNLPDTAIAQGLKARQIWGLAPRRPPISRANGSPQPAVSAASTGWSAAPRCARAGSP
jgi:hypothetical protein